MKNISVDEYFKEQMKDPEFRLVHKLQEQGFKLVKRIIDYRIKNNLTQGALAKKAGVSQQHISKIENFEFSNLATLEKVLLHIGFRVKIEAVPLSPAMKRHMKVA